MGVHHWISFQKNFGAYFNGLVPEHVRMLTKMTTDEFFSMPHLLFHGPDTTFVRMAIDEMLSRVVSPLVKSKKSVVTQVNVSGNKHDVCYLSSDIHIEIDFCKIQTGERQFVSDMLQIIGTKSVNTSQTKRIVVMHGIDDANSLLAFRKALESFSKYTMFIMSAKSISAIPEAIVSRCTTLRCAISADAFYTFCEDFVNDHTDIREAEVDRNDTLAYTIISFGTEVSKGDGIDAFITKHLDSLFAGSGTKKSDLENVLLSNKSFAFQILHFQIEIAYLFRQVIRYANRKKVPLSKLAGLVRLAADLQHKSVQVSKPSIPIERMLLEVWYICQSLKR